MRQDWYCQKASNSPPDFVNVLESKGLQQREEVCDMRTFACNNYIFYAFFLYFYILPLNGAGIIKCLNNDINVRFKIRAIKQNLLPIHFVQTHLIRGVNLLFSTLMLDAWLNLRGFYYLRSFCVMIRKEGKLWGALL